MIIKLTDFVNILTKGLFISIFGIFITGGIFIMNAFALFLPRNEYLWEIVLYFGLCTFLGLFWKQDLIQDQKYSLKVNLQN